jgi:hypothetical protein
MRGRRPWRGVWARALRDREARDKLTGRGPRRQEIEVGPMGRPSGLDCAIELDLHQMSLEPFDPLNNQPFTLPGLSHKTMGARSVFRNAISSSCCTSERPVKRFADGAAWPACCLMASARVAARPS